jgi:hypothetical protein
MSEIKEAEALRARLRAIAEQMHEHAVGCDDSRPTEAAVARQLQKYAIMIVDTVHPGSTEAAVVDSEQRGHAGHPSLGYAFGGPPPSAAELNRLIAAEETLSAQVASLQVQRDELQAENRRARLEIARLQGVRDGLREAMQIERAKDT